MHTTRRACACLTAALLALAALGARAGAAEWNLLFHTPTNENITVFSSPSDDVAWFITNFNRLYKTTDAGASWSVIPPGPPNFVPSGLFAVDATTAFKTGIGVAYKTTDGGSSWSTVFSQGVQQPPDLWMLDSQRGVLAYNSLLYRSTNGGSSWSTAGITQPPHPVSTSNGRGVVWALDNALWVAMDGFGVAVSSDFGASWSMPGNQGATFGHAVHISFGSASRGMAIWANWPFVYTTIDGGGHWVEVDNSLGANQEVLAMGSECWYIPNPADHFYIKYSSDAGASWVEQQSEQAGYTVLGRSRSGSTLWAGTLTGRLFTHQVTNPAAVAEDALPRLVVWPNPSAGELHFTADARVSGYRLIGIDGRIIGAGPLRGSTVSFERAPGGSYLLQLLDEADRPVSAARVVRR
ncbi:MAG: hypothetical protein U0527_05410 [Candidatus Eisenbacteria bacterium]